MATVTSGQEIAGQLGPEYLGGGPALPSGLYVATSSRHGDGIFTGSAILPGSVIGRAFVEVGAMAPVRIALGSFLNHDDDPNCLRVPDGIWHNLVSKRTIGPGEELTLDYAVPPPAPACADHIDDGLCSVCGRGLRDLHGGGWCVVHGKVSTCCDGA